MAELLKKVFDLDNNKLSLWLSWWCVAGILTSWQIEFVNSRGIFTRQITDHNRSPQQQSDESSEYNFSPNFGQSSNQRPRGHQVARQLMLHNQEMSSGTGIRNLPLYKQSYPGLYTQSDLKEFASYEPTMPVSHGYAHHGKEGHLFLLQPDTTNIYRSVAHGLYQGNLI